VLLFHFIGVTWEANKYVALFTFVFVFILLLGSLLTRSPLPLRINRQTREVYFMHGGKCYRQAWDTLPVRVSVMFTHVATASYSRVITKSGV
jgi:hypothetical protein